MLTATGVLDAPPRQVRQHLVGRDDELRSLTAIALAADPLGHRVAVVDGPTGAGHSALLAEVAACAAEQAVTVLRAQGAVSERREPFGVLRQLFGAGLVVPLPRTPDGPVIDVDLFYRTTASLADSGPVVLVVDDAQWSDPESVRWLASIGRRMHRLPVTVIVGASSHLVREHAELAELTRHARRFMVGDLVTRDIAELITTRLERSAPGSFVRACQGYAGGNPLLLTELLTILRDRAIDPRGFGDLPLTDLGSTRAGHLLLRRLRAVDPTAEALVKVVATLGPLDIDVAAAIADLLPAAARDVLTMLADDELLTVAPDTGTVAVRYDFARDSIVALTSHVDRQALHLRAATVLHDRHAADDTVARHLVQVPTRLGMPWVTATLRAAATRAMVAGRPHVARAYLRRAVTENPGAPEHLADLGVVEFAVAPDAAVDHLTLAFRRACEPDQIAGIGAHLAGALMERKRIPDGLVVLDNAIGRIDPSHTDLVESLRDYQASASVWQHPHALRCEPTREGAGAALAFLDSVDADRTTTATWRAVELLARGSLRKSLCEHHSLSEQIYAMLALLHAEAYDEVRSHAEVALARAEQNGLLLSVCWANTVRGLAEHALGTHRSGAASARACLAVQDNDGPGHLFTDLAASVLAACLTQLGDTQEAQQVLARYQLDGPLPELWSSNHVLHTRGILHLANGDARAALADFLECGHRLRRWGATNPSVLPWRSWAAIALSTIGDRAEAIELAAQEVELARQAGAREALGTALLVHAVLGGAAHDTLGEATELLRDVRAHLASGARVVSVENRLGTARSTSGPGPAQRAIGLLRSRGRHVLAAQLDRLAGTPTGGPRSAAARPTGLSPHEQRLAKMALGGATNEDIAREFSVSRRAIEFHFTQIYRKLGISRRAQLYQAMAA